VIKMKVLILAAAFFLALAGTAHAQQTLTANVPATVTINNGQRVQLSFTAPSAGVFSFESSNDGSLDPVAFSAASGTGSAVIIDDDGGEGRNFQFAQNLRAGEVFTFFAGVHRNTGNGRYAVIVQTVQSVSLAANVPATVDINNGQRVQLSFSAPSAGAYIFESSNNGTLDPVAFSAASGTGSAVIINDDGGQGRNFRFTRNLSAGEVITFFSGVHRNTGSGSYTVSVITNAPAGMSPSDILTLEQRTFELINIERERHNLPPLILHNALASVSRANSEEMLRVNSLDASGLDQRISQAGITNIAGMNRFVAGNNNTPEQRVTAWMNSNSSRAAILDEDRSHVAIGIVQRQAGSNATHAIYWTLMVITVPIVMTPSEILAFEQRVLELTNIERVNHGLPPLIWHEPLAVSSRAHSLDMMRNDLGRHTGGGHTGSDGSTASQRMERAGVVNGRFYGENISYGRATPEAAVAGWMNSPGHRANILDTDFTHLGVGLTQRPEGSSARFMIYTVQNFCAF